MKQINSKQDLINYFEKGCKKENQLPCSNHPNFNKNNQDDIDEMFLSEECLKNYPKRPS